jgi:8-oxo-dGTP diphosphatase
MKPPRLTIPYCEIRRRERGFYSSIKTTPIDDDIIAHIFAKRSTMLTSNPESVRVGVSVVIFRLRPHESEKRTVTEFLLGLRGGKHCPGTWGLPGGAMEFGEDPFETAHREVKEEVGFSDENLFPMYPNQLVPYGNTVFENGKHFVTLYFVAPWKSGEPRRMEPEKCLEWRWVTLDNLPQPLFPALVSNPTAIDRLGWVKIAAKQL